METPLDIRELKKNWDELGRTDPMWAIITADDKRRGRWDAAEFFATGQQHVDRVMAWLAELGLPERRASMMDFGCGIGRLTQAFATYFDRSTGVDIAPSMINQAREQNQRGQACRYSLIERDDLEDFADAEFDLVYSFLVLQHMEPRYAKKYIGEFVRILAPGGAAVFQLPGGFVRQPLPPSACRADIDATAPPGPVRAGQRIDLEISVCNAGDTIWPATPHQGLRVGNHWLDAGGRVSILDDARAALPKDVAPGDTVTLTLSPTAPARPGHYLLELTMVQEGVAWFEDHGSGTRRLPVRVRRRPIGAFSRWLRRESAVHTETPAGTEGGASGPIMEMHAVPKEEVEALVVEAGGTLVRVDEDGQGGSELSAPGWQSFTYVVGKG